MVRKMNVADDGTRLIASAEDVFGFENLSATAEVTSTTAAVLKPTEVSHSKPYRMTTQGLSESPRPPVPSKPVGRFKELKSAAELAEMIELDLAQHPDCPKNGFRVTVYGATHWRAMLTITTAAGRVSNPQQWRDFTDELADRLRQRYDLAWT
jgi:hypothetical protein